jgi:hypothetical protein
MNKTLLSSLDVKLLPTRRVEVASDVNHNLQQWQES